VDYPIAGNDDALLGGLILSIITQTNQQAALIRSKYRGESTEEAAPVDRASRLQHKTRR